MDLNIALALLWMALNLADSVTTYKILNAKGGKELNPVLRWVFAKAGLNAGLVLKMLLAGVYAIALLENQWALVGGSVMMAAVVMNNVFVIRRLKKQSNSYN